MYGFLNSQNAAEYERFVEAHENGSFMQSLAWANVKANWESEAIISRDDSGKIRGACLVLVKKIPLVKCAFLYAPRGPVCNFSDSEALSDIAAGIDILAKKYGAFAAMCDPPLGDDLDASALENAGFALRDIPEEHLIQCRFNYVLELKGKTLYEIYAGFKPDYRNRISKAERRGVWCEELRGEAAINALPDFYELMKQTGRRDGFPIRSLEYFARFLRSLGEHAALFMCYAKLGGVKTPLSGAIAVNYGKRFAYVYGASGDEHRELYPSYLMQWTMITAGHGRGDSVYDFGGVPFYHDETRREYGIYRFKKGFGGDVASFAGQFVKVYRPFLEKAAVIFAELQR
ncbi:MAG: aminoacyltransferase [Oscillospiraceae bacterium]|nr:aminoacyltransferase [Oscillospiraceae bacterium]